MKKYDTWDLTSLLKSDNDPKIFEKRKEITKNVSSFIKKWQKRDDYLKDPKVLAQVLKEYEKLLRFWWPDGAESYYFYLRSEQEQTNPKIKAKLNNANEFSIDLVNKLRFFSLKIAKIKNQKQFLKAKELLPFKHFLKRTFAESKFLLSENEEKILSLKHQISYENWVKMTAGFLAKEEKEIILNGKRKKVNFSELFSYLKDSNKKNRDNAAEIFNQILEKYSDLAEVELNSVLQNKKIDDNLRKFEFPESSRLLSDDIEKEIVDQMVKIVSSNFKLSKKVYELKAKLFGVKKLQYHERNLDFGQTNRKFSFDDTVKIVAKITNRLDPEFEQIFEMFLKNHQIDIFPRKDKRSGAFCQTNLITEPTFILLNFNNKLEDVVTLAHELGHGINSELMKKNVSALNFGTSLAVAEVASTFMEDFVLDEILKTANDELRLGVLIQRLDRETSSIFRQIACYQFEQELHQQFRQKNYLSKQEIGQLFQKHMKNYMGNFVEQSKGSENWWVYWNHIRSYFYNYSYANGLLISKSLQNMVRNNPAAIAKVKRIFSAGLSDSPKNIFLKEGIDISKATFWQNGISEIEIVLKEAQNLAKKLNKI